jgi:exopolysaccharide biosynthesis predicted pyruvyltransferase EpsI
MKELNPKIFLERFRYQKIDFFRFPGNYGDSLIWHGTKKMLNSLNITPCCVELSSPIGNDVLVIDGGGNFVDYYSDVKDFLIKKGNLYKEIIILPHTIFGAEQIKVLNNLECKITVFCREKISFAFVEKNFSGGKVYLWHDCAFYNTLIKLKDGVGALNVFRKDKESIVNDIPDSNEDLSYDGYATKPLDYLIDRLVKYESINTDRLHIAICATLLGKKVKLFPNSYYKNKAVYDYSLSGFTNISFINYINEIKS